jgi:hypothetical protein
MRQNDEISAKTASRAKQIHRFGRQSCPRDLTRPSSQSKSVLKQTFPSAGDLGRARRRHALLKPRANLVVLDGAYANLPDFG